MEEGKNEFLLEVVLDGAHGKVIVVSNHIVQGLLNAFIGVVGNLDIRRRWRWWGAEYNVQILWVSSLHYRYLMLRNILREKLCASSVEAALNEVFDVLCVEVELS